MAEAYAEVSALSYTVEVAQKTACAKPENADDFPADWNLLREDFHKSFLKDTLLQSEDFILLSEFSEVEGPVPLLTIPLRVQESSEIDLNHFIIKIMSIDYQTSNSGQFSIFQDTQVLRTDICQNFHAYIHYFTLYDIKARGFVRPFCLAFNSCDHQKLQKNLANLQEEFLKITRVLKYSNCHWFREELQQLLLDLERMRGCYVDLEQRLLLETSGEYTQKGTIESEEEKRALGNGPAGVGVGSLIYQPLSELCEVSTPQHTMSSLAHQEAEYKHIIHKLGPLLEDQAVESVISSWRRTVLDQPQSEFYRNLVKLKIITPQPLPYEASILFPISCPGRTFTSLRSVYMLCNWGLVAAFWKLTELHRHFSRDSVIFCFEKLGITRSVETCEKVGNNRRTGKCHVAESLEDWYCYPEYLEKSDFCELFKISERMPERGESESESVYCDAEEIDELKLLASAAECSSSYHSAPESLNDILGLHFKSIWSSNSTSHIPPDEMDKEALSRQSSHSDDSSGSYLDISMTSSLNNMLNVSATSSNDSSSTDSVCEESEDRGGEVTEYEKCSSDLFINVENILSGKPGSKILKFFKQYSQLAHHIIFSILIGRTVVVAGPDESRNNVRDVLQALTPFIPVKPGSTARVLRWHRGILVSAHTQSYRMIGLCVPERLSVHDMLSPREKNSVTILEVQAKQIFGPAYSGLLLTNFERNCQKYFRDEQSFLAYVSSVLVELESKVYFYKFKIEEMRETDKDQKHILDQSWTKSALELSRNLGIRGSDIEMMKYLARLLDDSDDVTQMF